MKAEAERRRPLGAAIALFGLICVGLLVPLLLSGELGKPSVGGYLSAAGHDRHTLTRPVELLAKPYVVLERGDLTLAFGNEGRGGKLLSLLTGGGAVLALDNAKVLIGPAEKIRAEVDVQTASEPLEPVVTALTGLSFRTLHLNNISAIVRTSGRPDEVLEDITGVISRDRNGAINAKLEFAFRGEKLFAEIALSPAGSGTAGAQRPLHAAIKSKHFSLTLDGGLVSGDRLQVTSSNAELSVPNLRQAAQWLNRSWPSGQGLGKLKVQGPIAIDEKSISFENARLTLDGNTATGSLSLTLGSERPSIEGTLAFDNLDIAPYIKTQRTGLLALAGAWLSNLPIPGLASPSLVHQIDADLRISARALSVGSDKFGRCAASISVVDGKLFGELAEMEFEYGGSGEGQFGADMTLSAPRYTLHLALDGIDMGRALAPYLGDGPGLEGTGDVVMDLSAKGSTSVDILSSLGGSVAIEMREGARLGISLDTLKSMVVGRPRPTGWGEISRGSTSVDTLTARFSGARGLFTAETVEALSAEHTIRAEGTLASADGNLDLTITVAPGNAQAGAERTGPSYPIYRLQGRWAAPAITRIAPPGKSAELHQAPDAPGPSAPDKTGPAAEPPNSSDWPAQSSEPEAR